MTAVIATGGKQYAVAEGDIISVEKLDGDVGATVTFNEVLMVKDGETVAFGDPLLKQYQVVGEIVSRTRGKKIEVVKFRRRKRYLRRQGHRQHITQVKITRVVG